MDMVLTTVIVTMCAVAIALGLLVRKVMAPSPSLPVTAEWIDEISIERYRPMMRLLDTRELEFLRAQPGFTPAMMTRVRSQRCRIFRDYLQCLNSDFGRVCAATKLVMLQSKQDRPDLAGALLRSQATFAVGLVGVEFRLFLYRWGVCGVDVTSLVKVFDSMRLELRTLVPSPGAIGA